MIKFEAGKYYVGDLCYVINDKHWDEIGEQTDWFQKSDTFEFKGKKVFVANTKYGDGAYHDYHGREYLVDAGLIGVMPFDLIDENFDGDGGQIIKFEKDFLAFEKNGIFYIGDIIIDTKNEDDEEEGEE